MHVKDAVLCWTGSRSSGGPKGENKHVYQLNKKGPNDYSLAILVSAVILCLVIWLLHGTAPCFLYGAVYNPTSQVDQASE